MTKKKHEANLAIIQIIYLLEAYDVRIGGDDLYFASTRFCWWYVANIWFWKKKEAMKTTWWVLMS